MRDSFQACSIELQESKQRIKAMLWRNRIAEVIPWVIMFTVGILGGWQVNALRTDIIEQSNILDEHCAKMKEIQDTLTSHSLTDNERTEKIETIVSQCLMDDNEPTRRMKN